MRDRLINELPRLTTFDQPPPKGGILMEIVPGVWGHLTAGDISRQRREKAFLLDLHFSREDTSSSLMTQSIRSEIQQQLEEKVRRSSGPNRRLVRTLLGAQ